MFRKDTALFRNVFGPGGWAPSARPHRKEHRLPTSASAATTPDRSRRVRADGAGRQGRVGVSTLPPPHPTGRGVGMPRPASQAAASTGTPTEPRPAGKRRAGAVGAGVAAGGLIRSSGSSPVVAVLRCGRGIPVRSHRTTVLLVRHRAVRPGCTLSDADLCPGHGAQSVAGPSPVGVGKPVGRWRRVHRHRGWSVVRRPPRSASVPPRPRRSRAPPSAPPRPAPAGPATRRRRRESGRHRWRPPR